MEIVKFGNSNPFELMHPILSGPFNLFIVLTFLWYAYTLFAFPTYLTYFTSPLITIRGINSHSTLVLLLFSFGIGLAFGKITYDANCRRRRDLNLFVWCAIFLLNFAHLCLSKTKMGESTGPLTKNDLCLFSNRSSNRTRSISIIVSPLRKPPKPLGKHFQRSQVSWSYPMKIRQ